jgi:glycosyltransferase involved in cell wall biosynthesis
MTWDQIFDVPDVNVAMAKWGEEYMKKHNVPRVRRIDHGVDLETFYPLINRAELKNKHIPNKFVVGFVGRNQQRKMIDRLIKGFAMFAQNKDDVILMMHTDK